MPCTRVRYAYRNGEGLTFVDAADADDDALVLPCGHCPDCQMRKRQEWALRIAFEARDHDRSSFLTLTLDEAHVPEDYGLDVRTWQLFAKRVRKRWGPMRFFACGEYGERGLRPHYHAIIFGLDWSHDREFEAYTPAGYPTWSSRSLSKCWGLGAVQLGTVTFESASYVAKYAQKGESRGKFQDRVDPVTGEVWQVRSPFAVMSRDPGIGYEFFRKWRKEIYQHDSVVMSGREYPIPRYFDRLHKRDFPEDHRRALERRHARIRAEDSGYGRFDSPRAAQARERVLTARKRITTRGEC